MNTPQEEGDCVSLSKKTFHVVDDGTLFGFEETEEEGDSKDIKWEIVSTWAKWERSGVLSRLSRCEIDELRQVVATYAKTFPGIEILRARLEMAEVMLTVGAGGAGAVAAFLCGLNEEQAAWTHASPEAKSVALEVSALRAIGLHWNPAADTEEIERYSSAWWQLDEAAAAVRRRVALATRDARALLAELAAVVITLRRGGPPTRHVALKAVHLHLPLADLLKAAASRAAESTSLQHGLPPVQHSFSHNSTQQSASVLSLSSSHHHDASASSSTSSPQLFATNSAYAALVCEIEDRAYSSLFPETYALLRSTAKTALRAADDGDALRFSMRVRQQLADKLCTDVSFFSPSGRNQSSSSIAQRLLVKTRVKSPASALRKMLRSGSAKRGAVRDMLGIRVIVLPNDDISNSSWYSDVDLPCTYAIYRAAIELWTELPGRFKDYIRNPKPNGYRSIHTTVWLDELPCELQIRTLAMHTVAETGRASHALYSGLRRDPELTRELLAAPAEIEVDKTPPTVVAPPEQSSIESFLSSTSEESEILSAVSYDGSSSADEEEDTTNVVVVSA